MADAERAPAAGAQEPVGHRVSVKPWLDTGYRAECVCGWIGEIWVRGAEAEREGDRHATGSLTPEEMLDRYRELAAFCELRGATEDAEMDALEDRILNRMRAAPTPQVAEPSGVEREAGDGRFTCPHCGETAFAGHNGHEHSDTCPQGERAADADRLYTHYDGCWREHHACAVAMIERGERTMELAEAMVAAAGLPADTREVRFYTTASLAQPDEPSLRADLERQIVGGLRATFNEHGDITPERFGSAAKRIASAIIHNPPRVSAGPNEAPR